MEWAQSYPARVVHHVIAIANNTQHHGTEQHPSTNLTCYACSGVCDPIRGQPAGQRVPSPARQPRQHQCQAYVTADQHTTWAHQHTTEDKATPTPKPEKKKSTTLIPRKWLKCDTQGVISLVKVEKHALIHNLGLQARDLRLLEPQVSTIPYNVPVVTSHNCFASGIWKLPKRHPHP